MLWSGAPWVGSRYYGGWGGGGGGGGGGKAPPPTTDPVHNIYIMYDFDNFMFNISTPPPPPVVTLLMLCTALNSEKVVCECMYILLLRQN